MLKIQLHCNCIKRHISEIKGEVFLSIRRGFVPIPSQANRQKAVSFFVEI